MTNLRDTLTQDLWVHIGALLAVVIGLTGDRYFTLGLGSTASLMFIIAGLAAFGVKLTNGSAKTISNSTTIAASAAAQEVRDAVAAAAAQVIADTATAAAKTVKDTALAAVPAPVPQAPPQVPPLT